MTLGGREKAFGKSVVISSKVVLWKRSGFLEGTADKVLAMLLFT